jgi:hypothetical protein
LAQNSAIVSLSANRPAMPTIAIAASDTFAPFELRARPDHRNVQQLKHRRVVDVVWSSQDVAAGAGG